RHLCADCLAVRRLYQRAVSDRGALASQWPLQHAGPRRHRRVAVHRAGAVQGLRPARRTRLDDRSPDPADPRRGDLGHRDQPTASGRAADRLRRGMAPRDLKIETDGGAVSALWLKPAKAKACLVLAHGAGAGMTHRAMVAVAEGLAERGIATL